MNPYEVDWEKFPLAFSFCLGWQDARESKPCLFRKGFVIFPAQEFYVEGYHAGMWFDTPDEETF